MTRLYTGTSGFAYKQWEGDYYPVGLSNEEMLRFYGEHLNSVEINNTFYRMPKREVLEKWASLVPAHFRFVIKASRRITHQQKLVETKDNLDYLASKLSALGDKQAPVLFQLPPYLKKNLALLEKFLNDMPDSIRPVLEFRSRSWFDDDVYSALSANEAALCVTDWEDTSKVAPTVGTAPFGYFRLRQPHYEDETLDKWLGEITEQGWEEAYVFFKHEEDGAVPRLAARMRERFEKG